MKKVFAVAIAMVASAYAPDSYRLGPSPEHRFSLEVEKTGLLRGKKHQFVFGRYHGTVEYDAKRPEASKVQFEIQSNTIMCLDTWVSDKDKVKIMKVALEDMLAADKYPTISFVSNRIEAKGDNRFDVLGGLSLRGILQNVTVAVTKTGDTYDGTATVNMKNYGLKPPVTLLGAVGTKELIIVSFHIAATR